MYQIRTEKHYTIRTYTADSYFDAVDLFHNLSKVLPFVQIWQGDKLMMEYNPALSIEFLTEGFTK